MTIAARGDGPLLVERVDWVRILARLTDGFVRAIPRGGSPARAQLPGAPAGDPVPSIEGLARMSVAWAAWLHESSNPTSVEHEGRRHDVAALLATGLSDATDPRHPAWWGPIGDRDQRIVEAAEIATALWLGGDRLADAIRARDPAAPDRILDWLALVDGRDLWPDNWVLFPVLPALVRRSAGRPVDAAAIDAAIHWMDDHAAGDGWYRDGAGDALDLYTGWAIHWHLLWWATIDGDRRPARRAAIVRRARAWLAGVAPLFAHDGSFPLFGRSLGYRFALAAPVAQAAFLGIDPLEPGVARAIAGGALGRALARGAIDAETDWFRVGVGGRRPEVVEGYVSAGASAWAAHAFLALAMPSTHPFWTAPLPASRGASHRGGVLAAADAGVLTAWSGTTGETRLFNGRIGHPADIADHDYAASYGKLVYRSAFPFDVPVGGGDAAADGALVAITADGRVAHRNESIAGSAGPGWIRSRYRLPTTAPTLVETVVLVANELEIRVSVVDAAEPVRIRESPGAIGCRPGGGAISRDALDGGGLVATDDARTLAIRPLLGYDAAGWGEPSPGRLNLLDDDAVHPFVEERAASAGRRLVATASIAVARRADAAASLAGVSVAPAGAGGSGVHVSWPGGDAWVRFRPNRPDVVEMSGHAVRGVGLGLVRVDADGAIAADGATSIDGIATFARPTIARIARADAGVEVVTATGVTIDGAWAGARLERLAIRAGNGPWEPAGRLDEPGVVADRTVRSIRRRLGTRLVQLRLEPAS